MRTTLFCPFFNYREGVKESGVEMRVGGAWIEGKIVWHAHAFSAGLQPAGVWLGAYLGLRPRLE